MYGTSQAKELGRVKRFATALFFNVLPPDSDRNYITLSDFVLFFEAAEGAGGGAAPAAPDAVAEAAPEGRKMASFGRREGPGAIASAGTGPGLATKSAGLPRDSKGPAAAAAAAGLGGGDVKSIGRMSLTVRAHSRRSRPCRNVRTAPVGGGTLDTRNWMEL
jgi:hypothetical protein